jgi:serine kinase of HPr protein (carbohydrate metabolism regulator)
MAIAAPAGGATTVQALTYHATTIAIGEAGVLIRGASGAGKTALALALIALARQGGRFARLVADDRTALSATGGRLLARPVSPLEGIVERRGLGLTPEPYLPAVVVRLVIDLSDAEPARMPEPEHLVEAIGGIDLPRLPLAGRPGEERLALAALDLFLDRATLDFDKF